MLSQTTKDILTVKRLCDQIMMQGGFYHLDKTDNHELLEKLVSVVDRQKHHAIFCNIARMHLDSFYY